MVFIKKELAKYFLWILSLFYFHLQTSICFSSGINEYFRSSVFIIWDLHLAMCVLMQTFLPLEWNSYGMQSVTLENCNFSLWWGPSGWQKGKSLAHELGAWSIIKLCYPGGRKSQRARSERTGPECHLAGDRCILSLLFAAVLVVFWRAIVAGWQ